MLPSEIRTALATRRARCNHSLTFLLLSRTHRWLSYIGALIGFSKQILVPVSLDCTLLGVTGNRILNLFFPMHTEWTTALVPKLMSDLLRMHRGNYNPINQHMWRQTKGGQKLFQAVWILLPRFYLHLNPLCVCKMESYGSTVLSLWNHRRMSLDNRAHYKDISSRRYIRIFSSVRHSCFYEKNK